MSQPLSAASFSSSPAEEQLGATAASKLYYSRTSLLTSRWWMDCECAPNSPLEFVFCSLHLFLLKGKIWSFKRNVHEYISFPEEALYICISVYVYICICVYDRYINLYISVYTYIYVYIHINNIFIHMHMSTHMYNTVNEMGTSTYTGRWRPLEELRLLWWE